MRFTYFVFFFFLIVGISYNSNTIASPKLISDNKVIDLQYELIKIDGLGNDEIYILEDLNGLVIISLWASWCGPCIEESDELNKFQERINKEKLNVRIIGINIFDDLEEASNFKIKYNPRFETLFDKNKTIPIDFGVVGVPETYFVKNNTVLFKYVGKITEEILEKGLNNIKNE